MSTNPALRSRVEARIEEMAIPAAVVLLRTPEQTWTEVFGTRRLGLDDPVTTEDHFRIGSNTKTMTGTALLQLVDSGSIALDDPVSRYRPDVPGGDRITVAQLLDMRSGLKSYTTLRSFNQVMDDEPGRAWDPEELVAIGLAEPVSFAPGEHFEYSNTNTVLAGLIVEQITGQPLAEVLDERIFTPLGMEHTVLPAIDDAAIPDPHPHGYLFGTNVSTLEPEDTILPEDQQIAARAGTLLPNDYTDLNPSWAWAAGAGISTVQDLATYVEVLVGGGPAQRSAAMALDASGRDSSQIVIWAGFVATSETIPAQINRDALAIDPTWRCLDAGCGGGDVTAELAQRVPRGRVVGLDVDAEQLRLAADELRQAGVDNVELHVADLNSLPSTLAGFDLVYARFVLTHLPAPEAVLAALVDACRPGGVIALEDIDVEASLCDPPTPAFDTYLDWYCRAHRERGGDPVIGRRLVSMLTAAGIDGVDGRVVQPAGTKGDVGLIAPLTAAASSASIVERGIATAAQVEELVRQLAELGGRADTLVTMPRVIQAWGTRP